MENKTTHDNAPTHVELKTRLDQLRVKLHLGGMNAHDKFDALSDEIVALSRKTTQAATHAARALLDRIRELEAAVLIPD